MGKQSEFHVHVDAFDLAPRLEDYFMGVGFSRTDFAGHPPGTVGYEPRHHLTLKAYSGSEFLAAFDKTVAAAETVGRMKGYIEGEFIASDETLAEKEYEPSVEPPISLSLGGLPKNTFRESEIHITMSRDRSHPELLRKLSEIGLFSAYIPKPTGLYQVFTVQGTRKGISQLLPILRGYLLRAGGAADASIKEERIVKWWLSDSTICLPPILQVVKTFDPRAGEGG
jgi:hypothetical protein